jgi:hypothetical protein
MTPGIMWIVSAISPELRAGLGLDHGGARAVSFGSVANAKSGRSECAHHSMRWQQRSAAWLC